MNPNEPIRESEFVLRRLGENFAQFRQDLWASIPIWLLVPAILAVIARIWYARHYRRTHGPAKPDAAVFWLGWAAILTVGTFVIWTLVEFYQRDTAQLKSGTTQLSALGEANKTYWTVFIGSVFAIGSAYVVLMYIRDTRTVKWYWALKLALIRVSVYGILCFVFLLPARQTWERQEKFSRVVVLIDISPSMTRVSDDVARKGAKTRTRMETLIEFLSDKDVALIKKLLETNPVAVYPFGTRLDESAHMITKETPAWGPGAWQEFVQYDFRPFLLEKLNGEDQAALRNTTNPVDWKGPKPTPGADRVEPGNWAEWADKWVKFRAEWAARKTKWDTEKQGKEPFREKLVNGISDAGNTTLAENIEKLERRVDVARSIAGGTNVPDSVAAAINRESPNMVQGVIVFSDMRSNLGSDSSYRELRAAAAREKIPVFMIAVGEDRQNTSISITEVQTDDVASPDEGFKVSVGADGVGLKKGPNGEPPSVNVELDIFLPGRDPKTDKPNYTLRDSRKDKTKGSPEPYTIAFAGTDPPHGQVEFIIDPARLAADTDPDARALVTESTDAAFKKPVLREGSWTVRARIARDENEAFPDEFHVRDRPGIQVIQKKLRVLLIASAPGREFQFLRTFLDREMAENRATLSLLIQNEAGTSGNLTPNPGEVLLRRFPTRLDLSNKILDPEERPYNLNEYDVIIGFDPDWTEVSKEQAEELRLWVERQGGGLILVADRINSSQLASAEENSRLSPILDILPCVPEDNRLLRLKRIPTTPRRLYLHAMPGSDLLKIDDPPQPEKKDGKEPENDPIAGWERFFTNREKYAESKDFKVEFFPRRGFFSSYPLKNNDVKPGGHVLAHFAELDEQNQPQLLPYIVVSNPASGFRTCYMASGEMYRMYAFDKEYYERYWAKMIKYMAAKRNAKASRGRVLTNKEIISGQAIRVTAQLLNTASKPYPPTFDAKFRVLQVASNGEEKQFGPYQLVPSGVEGYYKGQVTADPNNFPPGDYQYYAVVDVPESANETMRSNFRILKSDPEMDVTAPDTVAMMSMASPFDDAFQTRVSESVKKALLSYLPRENGVPKLAFKLSDKSVIKLIPECFKTQRSQSDNRGPTEDLWDEKIAIANIDNPERQGWLHDKFGFSDRKPERNERAATPFGDFLKRGPRVFRSPDADTPPVDENGQVIAPRAPNAQVTISWVLLVVVFLLCWEWLTRKLLRLA